MGSTVGGVVRDRTAIPIHDVTISKPFAIGRTEITRAQYDVFMRESGHRMGTSFCWYWNQTKMQGENYDPHINWQNPGYAQQEDHPVVCVDWHDAKAYAAWLEKKTGKLYRLPTEAEWEYAARAGTDTSRPWGDEANEACRFANILDATAGKVIGGATGKVGARRELHNCDDGFAYTAPVGRFQPNRFGIYDMIGNASEWIEDCWNFSYAGAPADGSAWTSGDCTRRVIRGANWFSQPEFARSAVRSRGGMENRDQLLGFRIARALP
jgi:formylglycine-generating enzyme required for sulfatase activity